MPVMEKQYMFLSQFWRPSLVLGSIRTSDDAGQAHEIPDYGSPCRRMAWLHGRSLIEIGVEDELRDFVLRRLSGPAHHFVNTP